jgi:hypothetical protein
MIEEKIQNQMELSHNLSRSKKKHLKNEIFSIRVIIQKFTVLIAIILASKHYLSNNRIQHKTFSIFLNC